MALLERTHTTKARDEVRQANDRIAELRGMAERGEPVSGSDLMAARADLEAAELRVTGARIKDNQAERQHIAAELQAVGVEITEYEAPDFPALLREVHTAARALAQAVTDHNGRVKRWASTIGRLGSTETTFAGRGGSVAHDGYVQAPASISALLGRVFNKRTFGLTESTPEHVEQAASAALDKAMDEVLRVQALAATSEADHEAFAEKASTTEHKSAIVDPLSHHDRDALRAAFLRHKRDVMALPFDANKGQGPGEGFPEWIDRADLVKRVPDYLTGQQMDSNRKHGFGFTADPGATARAVGVSGREYDVESKQQAPRPPGGVVQNGGAVLSDAPI